MSNLFDKTTNALATSIQMRQIRQNVTNSNIANAETPGYHAKKVDFEDALARALDIDGTQGLTATHGDHFIAGSPSQTVADIYDNPDVTPSNDGNTVDLEKEMANLSENTVLYKSAIQ
ncbi:MAG: flagellar basal body rod protein FlgB, partial [Pseudobdellovibrio sp.]